MEIKNKVIILTGASEGIGRSAAKYLADHGAKMVLAARSVDKINTLAKELPDATAVMTDMRKPEDIKNMVSEAMGKYGRVDILINNAGQGMYGPMENIDLEKYKQVMDLNVYSVIRSMQEVIPIMRKQGGGMILNIGSRVSKSYFPNLSAYASTKYALNAISLTARQELEKDNIVVSVLHPKMTATNFGLNAINSRKDARAAGQSAPNIDTPEYVAQKIGEIIDNEEAESLL